MRSDFSKILVERPRTGRNFAEVSKDRGQVRARQKATVAGELPFYESARNKRGRLQTKDFNENLSPLYRFIEKSVGRPWNKVYAELCEHLDRSNAVQAHVLQHLWDWVERNPLIIDGKICRSDRILSGKEISRDGYYVDEKGILRRGKGLTYRDDQLRLKAAEKPSFVPMGPGKIAKQDDQGLWYEVTLAEVPDVSLLPVRDVWRKRDLSFRFDADGSLPDYGQKGVYAVAKRALNSREIAELTGR